MLGVNSRGYAADEWRDQKNGTVGGNTQLHHASIGGDMKLGTDEGNSGAIIRWGRYLDNGIWIRRWRFRNLWLQWRFRSRYISLGFVLFAWGN